MVPVGEVVVYMQLLEHMAALLASPEDARHRTNPLLCACLGMRGDGVYKPEAGTEHGSGIFGGTRCLAGRLPERVSSPGLAVPHVNDLQAEEASKHSNARLRGPLDHEETENSALGEPEKTLMKSARARDSNSNLAVCPLNIET